MSIWFFSSYNWLITRCPFKTNTSFAFDCSNLWDHKTEDQNHKSGKKVEMSFGGFIVSARTKKTVSLHPLLQAVVLRTFQMCRKLYKNKNVVHTKYNMVTKCCMQDYSQITNWMTCTHLKVTSKCLLFGLVAAKANSIGFKCNASITDFFRSELVGWSW